MKPLRLFILFGIGFYGYTRTGLNGIFYALILFGFLAFIWYTMVDALARLLNFVQKPTTTNNYNLNVNTGETIKGYPDVEGRASRHPDPTRPDDEDFKVLTWRRPQ